MKRSSSRIFVLLLVIIYSWSFSNSVISKTSLSNPYLKGSTIFDSPFPLQHLSERDVAIVAALDGNLYLVDTKTWKILWSFSSGRPIYSSYQAIVNSKNDQNNTSTLSDDDYFIDCGDDWELYVYNKHGGKRKLPTSAEDYMRTTPHIANDGGVILGAKTSTVFLVDAKSGKVVYTYNMPDSHSTANVQGAKEISEKDAKDIVVSGSTNIDTIEELLYIKRTDYVLQHHSSDSESILWNLAFAEFDAEFRFQNFENSLISPNLESELIAKYRGYTKTRHTVLRIRDYNLIEFPAALKGLLSDRSEGRPLPLPANDHFPPSAAVDQFPESLPNNEGQQILALPSSETEVSGLSGLIVMHGGVADKGITACINASEHFQLFVPLVSALFSIIGFVFSYFIALRRLQKQNKSAGNVAAQPGIPKKKKNRRYGANRKTDDGKMMNNISHENNIWHRDELPQIEGSERKLPLFSNLVDSSIGGRRVGKLLVSSKEIAKGSNGTIVLEGIYDGRPVAVKRLVQTHHDVALKEIQNLIASDQHPNIVRWYGMEHDQDFVYLSLERCTCSLNDLIFMYSKFSQSPVATKDQDSNTLSTLTAQWHTMRENNKDVELYKANGYPSAELIKLMRDMVSGLAHLHELGIIHRDLKPQNVLIIKDRALCAKLSDMGISKRLLGDMSSLTQHATGYGSSGWQAPEQLLQGRQTRAVDLFSLGCVLFFCVTGGKHPFGGSIERDVNILNNQKDLVLVENIPEAVDLFSHLLDPKPDMRPKAVDVLLHPLFWSSEMRLSFLRDASDRVELEDREDKSELLVAIESIAPVALDGNWDAKMEAAFIINIGRYRRYKFDSVRDLLRVIRNKLNHYRELPLEIQKLLGPVPEGFESYFSSRFPRLLIEVYKVVCMYCKDEGFFHKYIKDNLI
ncbi:putative Kinase [Quillaja saponaria]|uniref:non-specific serine/threonine protein kinase n=1 Tax=Quillaja saponaria TaxID=32244 RepID=A0AAD7PT58_QUISA|nr:putative Kinase [Quillaja saponaria]